MALMIRDGDYVPDGVGGLKRVSGREALLQRVLFKLTARRGAFPFREELGSRLSRLPRLPASQRPCIMCPRPWRGRGWPWSRWS